MPPDSRYIPAEMWLAIAAHLSLREISQLARLCRPFAALAQEYNEYFISTLRLSVHVTVNRNNMHTYRDDGENMSLRYFTRRVKETIDSGRAPRVRKLVLYTADLQMKDAPQSSGILRQLSQRFARKSSGHQDLQYLYQQLSSVKTLTLLFKFSTPSLADMCPPIIGATWMAFSANLRELNISADTSAMLQLSGAGSTFALPRLQVMRFSYERRHPGDSDELTFQRLARMYSSSKNLKALELRFNISPRLNPPQLQMLLPPSNNIAALETFSLAATTDTGIHVALIEILVAFIKPHLATLVQFGLHCSPAEFGALLDSRLAFRSEIAFSFGSLSLQQFNRLAATNSNGKTGRLRDSTLELKLELRNDRAEVPCLTAFCNLCALSLGLRDIRLRDLVLLAATTPKLASLRLTYWRVGESSSLKQSPVRGDGSGIYELFVDVVRGADRAAQDTLKAWSLRDLVIASYYHHNSTCDMARELGLRLARMLPLVTSLNGCDMRDTPLSGPTDEEWIWNRNALLLEIAAERRTSTVSVSA